MPIQMMGSIFTPLALYTLGAQLAGGAKRDLRTGPLALVLVLKLLLAPAATWILALALGMPQGLTELFVVGAATPVGVLLAIYCAESSTATRLRRGRRAGLDRARSPLS